MKKLKSERGSITIFVLSTLLVALMILTVIYLGMTNKLTSQKSQINQIAGKYEVSTDEMSEIYNKETAEKEEEEGTSETGISVGDITKSPETYYGKTVDYTSENGQTGWKIFHADEETNTIYLITSTYIDASLLPEPLDASGTKGTKPTNTNSSYPKGASMSKVISSYTGSSRITDEKIKKLNNEFFNVKNFTSTSNNMKAVAYLLDKDAWASFKDTNGKADYVIGAPTIELLFNSYNQLYHSGEQKYQYEAINEYSKGYKISEDNGGSWDDMLDGVIAEDSFYVISEDTDTRSICLLDSFTIFLY